MPGSPRLRGPPQEPEGADGVPARSPGRRRGGHSFSTSPRCRPHRDPFVTIDPPVGIDQALHLERRGKGYRVRYAIADVAAFVTPGGPMDQEAHARGQTLYAPDHKARLSATALRGRRQPAPGPDPPRSRLGHGGRRDREGIEVSVSRALVRSRVQLDYAGAQRSLDDGTAEEPLQLLREVGTLRQEREARRGGITADPRAGGLPERERLRAPLSGSASDRGLERPDLADDRDGAAEPHAERANRRAARCRRLIAEPSRVSDERPRRSRSPGRRT